MNFCYILFILTFLVFPIVALFVSKRIRPQKAKNILFSALVFFIVHNLLFALGWSFVGDYLDYSAFALEYLLLCLIVSSASGSPKFYVRLLRVVGIITISLGAGMGLIGTIFFIPLSHECEADKIIPFQSNDREYEARRYSFGFVTLEDTRYTFGTYRKHRFLPFEQKIDETTFLDSRSPLNMDDISVSIYVNRYNEENLVFISSGTSFLKPLSK